MAKKKVSSDLSSASLSPKVLSYADVVLLAQEQAMPAITALTNALSADKTSDRITAAKELLDRGYGKTNQKIELSGELKQDVNINPEALELIDKLYTNKNTKKVKASK